MSPLGSFPTHQRSGALLSEKVEIVDVLAYSPNDREPDLLTWLMAADQEQALREAMWATTRAIELDSTDALGYALRGLAFGRPPNGWIAFPKRLRMASRSRDESQRYIRASDSGASGSCDR